MSLLHQVYKSDSRSKKSTIGHTTVRRSDIDSQHTINTQDVGKQAHQNILNQNKKKIVNDSGKNLINPAAIADQNRMAIDGHKDTARDNVIKAHKNEGQKLIYPKGTLLKDKESVRKHGADDKKKLTLTKDDRKIRHDKKVG